MSSGAVNPIDFPQAWDAIVLGGVTSPGKCEVSEAKRSHEYDVKKGKGTLGATITFVGRPPAKFSVKFFLWQASHFAQWDAFRPLLKYDPTKKKVSAIDIYHPSLADVEINSVVVESIGNIMHAGDGLYTISVDFLEYFPPPKASAVSTPNGSTSGTSGAGTGASAGATPPAAVDAQQAQIAALLKQAQGP